jgi:hypothetical protein
MDNLGFFGQMIIGFIAFWAAGVMTFGSTSTAGPAICIGVMLIIWVSMGVIAVWHLHCPGFVAGELLGLGLVLLALGLCVSMLRGL